MEKIIQTLNGKRLKVATIYGERTDQERAAIVISHGRTAIRDVFNFKIANWVSIPANLSVSFYVQEFGTLTNRELTQMASSLIQGIDVQPVDRYQTGERIRNYVIRPDLHFSAGLFSPSSRFDVIFPLDVMHMDEVLRALKSNGLCYREVHMLACRGLRFTHTRF